jgi:hypothetical protein
MALSGLKKGVFLMSAMAALLLGCSSRDGLAAYWVVDRIEEGVAVLENAETLQTAECPAGELPRGVKEGDMLTGGGAGGPALRLDRGASAARAARLRERRDRLLKY